MPTGTDITVTAAPAPSLALTPATATKAAKAGAPIVSTGAPRTFYLAPELAGMTLVNLFATNPELFWAIAQGTFPFPSWRAYNAAMRTRWKVRNLRFPEQARALLKKDADKALDQVNVTLDQLVAATGLDDIAHNVLTLGLSLTAAGIAAGIAIGAAAGAGACGIGALIGGAVGAVVGICIGLWPFERMDFLGKWGHTVEQYEVIERYALLAGYRRVMDHARQAAHQPVWPAWRMGSQGGFLGLGNNIWGGPDTIAKFAHEELWRRDCIPANTYPVGHPVVVYSLCVQASPLEDGDPLESSFLYRLTSDGNGNQWMRPHMTAAARRTAGDLRAQAASLGMHDFADAPITPEFQDAINRRKREVEARLVAARGGHV